MEELILISYLNDFIFCPMSIYFHKMYKDLDTTLYQTNVQIEGTQSHSTIDKHSYSTRKNILQGIPIYSYEYNLVGKIDIFDTTKGVLTERKNYIANIYDGYIFQLYAQYYALVEMGYTVNKLKLYSMKDNKNYPIQLPHENVEMDMHFKNILQSIHQFNIESFKQTNIKKCKNCIYEPSCDRSLLC